MKSRLLGYSLGIALSASAMPATAAHLFDTDYFDYTVGDLVGQGPWLASTTTPSTPPVQVVAGSLTYAGGGLPSPPSGTNSVQLQGIAGQDVRMVLPGGTIPSQEGNTYYWSAVIMWDGTDPGEDGANSYFGGYLASAATGATTYRGILRVAKSDFGFPVLGTQVGSTSDTPTEFVATEIQANQPVFVVIKYTEVPGTMNDTTDIFLFVADPVPATEPSPSATAGYVASPIQDRDLPTTAAGGMAQFGLRQFRANSLNFPSAWIFDQLRAGTTWEDVISDPTSVGDWMLHN